VCPYKRHAQACHQLHGTVRPACCCYCMHAASWLYGSVEGRGSVDDGQHIKGHYQASVRSQVHGKEWKTISSMR
jgi:hypothetical protein